VRFLVYTRTHGDIRSRINHSVIELLRAIRTRLTYTYDRRYTHVACWSVETLHHQTLVVIYPRLCVPPLSLLPPLSSFHNLSQLINYIVNVDINPRVTDHVRYYHNVYIHTHLYKYTNDNQYATHTGVRSSISFFLKNLINGLIFKTIRFVAKYP